MKLRKKIIITIIIAVIVIITLAISILLKSKGITTEKFSNNNQYKLNESVQSDILELTLNTAQFAIALENGYGENYATPKEYDATKDKSNPNVAAKGHTLVAFSFTLKNLDRSSIDIGGNFNPSFTSVKYKGNTYKETAIFKAESKDELNWKSYSSSNILLEVGKSMMYRAYIDIPIDIENLQDTFELEFYLPNSKGKQDVFNYIVTAEDRNNQVEKELSLDVAFDNFTHHKAYEYFINHYSEYEVLNDSQIKELIDNRKKVKVKSISFSEDGKRIGYNDNDSYEFIFNGDLKDNYGYANNIKWKIEDNKLVLSYRTDNGEHIRECEVRKIPNKGYLLIWQGKPIEVFY